MVKFLSFSLLTCFLAGFVYHLPAQELTKRYFVSFKDKTGTAYSLNKPEDFLSPRAIERRQRYQIPVLERDLPVSATYLKALQSQGATVWYASKWMNGALIEADSLTLLKVQALDFVKPEALLVYPKASQPLKNVGIRPSPKPLARFNPLLIEKAEDYGKARNQTEMIGADEMHKAGYRGQGMLIAVFDAGFLNADKLSFFQHLFKHGQILGTYDFVEGDEGVYETGDHGTKVLSTIAAYKKGEMIGTAPEAFFFLFRTEDTRTEYRVEEVNWLIAAEKADSAGVDVINSSLGYTTFDDAKMDYSYQTLNGKTSFITLAAELAAQTGMLVVNSAGNEGSGDWRYVGTPADAPSILSVGAVDSQGGYAYFSSVGPTADGRIKPNVSARGSGTYGRSSRRLHLHFQRHFFFCTHNSGLCGRFLAG
ncbi:MAG: S8 family serine peptidase [Microscillaceae bacterium]|nr:S8 family serine peptidase [Microscillaceae bacterium]